MREVLDLQRHEGRPTTEQGRILALRHLPGRSVRDTDVSDLPGPHQVIQDAHGFLDGCVGIVEMHPVEVHAVGAQAAQALLQLLLDGLPARPARVGIPPVEAAAELGGQHEPVPTPPFGEVVAQDRFAVALRIDVGRVQEVAPRLQVAVQHGAAFGHIGAPAPVAAEGHGAQGEWADPQPRTSEGPVIGEFHGRLHGPKPTPASADRKAQRNCARKGLSYCGIFRQQSLVRSPVPCRGPRLDSSGGWPGTAPGSPGRARPGGGRSARHCPYGSAPPPAPRARVLCSAGGC